MSTAATSEKILEQIDALYEFEREPVTPDKLQSGRHFAALFAGEHVAGTEFVIGALFVSWGATTKDILLGLLLGNLLAVLSWTLVCAPIAVKTRLTLYWYLRQIAGPAVTALYNVLNAILFCILAGAMITVSASAVRIPFGIEAQTKWHPEDWRFVVLVFVLGAIVVYLAIRGVDALARFASICSPWIFAMFFAGAVAMLPTLGGIHSISDFLNVADSEIWTGIPPAGQPKIGFWHVVAFAWICNLAMHIGLSDMALLRYAKNSSYGLYSACGMYLGHYLAWITAGIMGAAVAKMLQRPLPELDAGDVAYRALGVAGAIAVIFAGWTTSNPTLYRAGLAFQAVTPGWSRWLVTLIAGIVTTVMACFPFVFTGLLAFVAIYGILLMPVGAIVVVEHWLFPRIGFTQFLATRTGKTLHWPALAAWLLAMAAAYGLQWAGLHMFFLAIPVWLITAGSYVIFSHFAGASRKPDARVTPGVAPFDSPHPSRPEPSQAGRSVTAAPETRDPARTTSGIVALATLLLCLALPIWVFLGGPGLFEQRRLLFHNLLLAVTLIHLTAAWIWVYKTEAWKRHA